MHTVFVPCNITSLVHVFTCVVLIKYVNYLQPISESVTLTQQYDCIFYDMVSDLSCPRHIKPPLQQKRNNFYIQSCINLMNYTVAIYGMVRRTLMDTVSYDQLFVGKTNF